MSKSMMIAGAMALAASRTGFAVTPQRAVDAPSPSGGAADGLLISSGSQGGMPLIGATAMLGAGTALAMRTAKRRSILSRKAVDGKKTQCVHPDKPMMFACADCPRRGKCGELDDEPLAVAAFVGECSDVSSKKTQCVHPDKPMMFACADCPRRG